MWEWPHLSYLLKIASFRFAFGTAGCSMLLPRRQRRFSRERQSGERKRGGRQGRRTLEGACSIHRGQILSRICWYSKHCKGGFRLDNLSQQSDPFEENGAPQGSAWQPEVFGLRPCDFLDIPLHPAQISFFLAGNWARKQLGSIEGLKWFLSQQRLLLRNQIRSY